MARLGRYFIGGQPLHAIQRVNDRTPRKFAPLFESVSAAVANAIA